MFKILKYIVLTLFVASSLYLLIWTITKSNAKQREEVCTGLTVEIVDEESRSFLTTREIIALLKDKNIFPVGEAMHSVQTNRIEETVQHHNMVDSVECFKSPNGVVRIVIEQRKPLFRHLTEVDDYYIDENRKKMPTSQKYVAYVPIVTGKVSQAMLQNEIYDFVLYIVKDSFWNNQIEQINVNHKKEIEIVPRMGQQLIKLGKLKGYETKLEKLRKFYKHGMNHIGWAKYTSIDIRYKNQIICK